MGTLEDCLDGVETIHVHDAPGANLQCVQIALVGDG